MELILGIDPGSRITGFGIIGKKKGQWQYVSSGCIRVSPQKISIGEKLATIFEGVHALVSEYMPKEIAIESVFMHKNAQSALKLGQARGVAIVAASIKGIGIYEYSPRQIKQAVVGFGGAQKEQVQQMVARLLCLSALPQTDAADGLAVALCHAHAYRMVTNDTYRKLK